MALVRWNPMKEDEGMQRRFDNLFGSTMGPMGAAGSMGALPGPQPLGLWGSEQLSESDWTLAVDVAETNEGYLLNAERPDVKKDDVGRAPRRAGREGQALLPRRAQLWSLRAELRAADGGG